eukprot:15358881-Ditylum_brightwellii.AAC.1
MPAAANLIGLPLSQSTAPNHHVHLTNANAVQSQTAYPLSLHQPTQETPSHGPDTPTGLPQGHPAQGQNPWHLLNQSACSTHAPPLPQPSHSAWPHHASFFNTAPSQLPKEEEWPKFTWDSHFFVWFLKISTILDHPEWGNGILTCAPTTTPELEQLSS